MRIGEKCDRLIRELKSRRGYKVYANKDAARKAGAKRCNGKVGLVESYHVYRGECGGCHFDQFVGYDVKCSKCGHEYAHYGMDELEHAIREQHDNRGLFGY